MSSKGVVLSESSVMILKDLVEEKDDQLEFFKGLKRVTHAEFKNYELQQKLLSIARRELEES